MALGVLGVASLSSLNLVGDRLAWIIISRHIAHILGHFIACDVFLWRDETIRLGNEANTRSTIILVTSQLGNQWEHCFRTVLVWFYFLVFNVLINLKQRLLNVCGVKLSQLDNLSFVIVLSYNFCGFTHWCYKDGRSFWAHGCVDNNLKVVDENQIFNHNFPIVRKRSSLLIGNIVSSLFAWLAFKSLSLYSFALKGDEDIAIENRDVVNVAIVIIAQVVVKDLHQLIFIQSQRQAQQNTPELYSRDHRQLQRVMCLKLLPDIDLKLGSLAQDIAQRCFLDRWPFKLNLQCSLLLCLVLIVADVGCFWG